MSRTITMVKKRFADGSTCKKCEQAQASLERRGLWERIDQVIVADETDADSPGMVLAKRLGVELAPFFVVTGGEGGEEQVFTSVVALRRQVLEPKKPKGDQAGTGAALDDGSLEDAAEGLDAQGIVDWALGRFGGETALAFSGAEDVVLIDLAVRSGKPFQPFVLDTGRLHPETLEYLEAVREHYGLDIAVMSPQARGVQALVRDKGLFSFYRDGHAECCGVRKVEPLARALGGRPAWLTGQRRDQSPTRAEVPVVQLDPRSTAVAPLVKVNPLAEWSLAEVWDWIRVHELPANPLHERGFVSIGCAPCTRPPRPGEHPRAGRWWWEEATHRECGLHVVSKDAGGEA